MSLETIFYLLFSVFSSLCVFGAFVLWHSSDRDIKNSYDNPTLDTEWLKDHVKSLKLERTILSKLSGNRKDELDNLDKQIKKYEAFLR